MIINFILFHDFKIEILANVIYGRNILIILSIVELNYM